MKALAQKVLDGDIRAVSRAISLVENDVYGSFALLKELFPHTGKSHVIGVTGPPGAGKSTLTDKLIERMREQELSVGVIAVDPTSPFTGGAILGDRIRMSAHFLDSGVFIRSMATRGTLGGVAGGTFDAVTVLDAAGKDVIIIETVGVGQDEIDIINMAHTSAVVLVPGMGDEVQVIKAGILEIGDLFVINKADRHGVKRLETELNMMLDLAHREDGYRPPVLKTTATDGTGVDDVLEAMFTHREFLKGKEIGHRKEIKRCTQRIIDLWKEAAVSRLLPGIISEGELEQFAEKMAARQAEPYSLIEDMLARFSEEQS